MIPIFKPEFGEKEIFAIEQVMDSGMIVCGDKVRKFEEKFAEYVGCNYAVGVNSCTSALFLAFLSLGYNYRVGIPSVTFVSVINMALKAQLNIKFEDLIFVGSAYKIDNTNIYDCAHDIYRGQFKNTYINSNIQFNQTIMCYSFYPTKNLASIEGGMICVNDKGLYNWFLKMRMHGMIRNGYDWDYSIDHPGWKFAMNEIQAAVGLVQLEELDSMLEKRKNCVDLYNSILGLDNKSLHLYPVIIENRDKLMEVLKNNEIGYSVHFKPCHLQLAFKNVNKDRNMDKSEHWGEHELSLPLYPSLKPEEIEKICKIVKNYL